MMADETVLQERLAELELALEDNGWARLGLEGEHEFSREGLNRITRLARLMVLKNPLVRRAVHTQANYMWGRGMTIRARHPLVDEVVQAFLRDEKNRDELTGHQARALKEIELQTDGNLFFVFFVNRSTGRVRIRTIPLEEIEEIVCNPEDGKEPWFYRRVWQERRLDESGQPRTVRRVAYYPDWRYHHRGGLPAMVGGHPVARETPVYHVRVGGFASWKFGVSEIYAALDWARAYKEFLEDWATITRSYSRFAWNLTTRGGSRGVSAARSRLGTSAGSGTGAETNPPPVTGSVFVAGDGVRMEPIRTAGATTSAEDGRRMLLMVAAAAGLPETFFGDVSVGSRATATSLDRPVELQMRNRQTLWADIHRDILSFVVRWAVKAPNGRLFPYGHVERGDEGEERVRFFEEEATGKRLDDQIDIDFPPIVEMDTPARVQSILAAAPYLEDKALVARLLRAALGEDRSDERSTT